LSLPLSIVIIPLLFGTVGVGVNMGTMVQAVQVSRDVAHMYARGVDFSQTANQNIAITLAPNSNITTTGGNGVLILSQITQVYQADCNAAGLTGTCTNLGQTVFTNRIVIGNSSLTSSRYGTPAPAIVDSAGNLAAADYLTNPTAVATGFSAVLTASGYTLGDGDVVYLSETYLSTPNLSFLGTQASNGVYAQSIF
jgi:hypothetical protein